MTESGPSVVVSLVEKLDVLASNLSEEEQASLKLLLGIAAGGLAAGTTLPTSEPASAAFSTVLQCLAHMQPTGIAWQGRPSFLDRIRLANLISECKDLRTKAEISDRYLLVSAGPQAQALTESAELARFLAEELPFLSPSLVASYIYYEGSGAGLDPHIDTDRYEVNIICLLEHKHNGPAATASHLIVYNPDGSAERILLGEGECVVLYAGNTVHARENLASDEAVTLLTIGCQLRS